MRIQIENYNLNKYLICAFSTCEDTDIYARQLNKNVFHYEEGLVTLYPYNLSYNIGSRYVDFFNSLNDLDVIEISSDGVVNVFFSQNQEDTTLFVTPHCNSNCIMCPSSELSRQNGEAYDSEQMLQLLSYIPPDKCKHITITGGEPFLARSAIFTILKYIKQYMDKTETLLLTNGRAFCIDGYAEMIAATMPKRFSVGIPIHGNCDELHNTITQAVGSFKQTIYGISKLIQYGVPVELRIVVSRLNSHKMMEIAEMIVLSIPGVYTVHFIGLEMLGNAALNADKVWLSYKEAIECIIPAVDYLVNNGINVELYNFPLCSVRSKYWSICRISISDYKRYYSEKCQMCILVAECGGIFAGSRRFAEKEIFPIYSND